MSKIAESTVVSFCERINSAANAMATKGSTPLGPYAAKSARAGLREQEARRTERPRAERRPVVQAKRSGEQHLASN